VQAHPALSPAAVQKAHGLLVGPMVEALWHLSQYLDEINGLPPVHPLLRELNKLELQAEESLANADAGPGASHATAVGSIPSARGASKSTTPASSLFLAALAASGGAREFQPTGLGDTLFGRTVPALVCRILWRARTLSSLRRWTAAKEHYEAVRGVTQAKGVSIKRRDANSTERGTLSAARGGHGSEMLFDAFALSELDGDGVDPLASPRLIASHFIDSTICQNMYDSSGSPVVSTSEHLPVDIAVEWIDPSTAASEMDGFGIPFLSSARVEGDDAQKASPSFYERVRACMVDPEAVAKALQHEVAHINQQLSTAWRRLQAQILRTRLLVEIPLQAAFRGRQLLELQSAAHEHVVPAPALYDDVNASFAYQMQRVPMPESVMLRTRRYGQRAPMAVTTQGSPAASPLSDKEQNRLRKKSKSTSEPGRIRLPLRTAVKNAFKATMTLFPSEALTIADVGRSTIDPGTASLSQKLSIRIARFGTAFALEPDLAASSQGTGLVFPVAGPYFAQDCMNGVGKWNAYGGSSSLGYASAAARPKAASSDSALTTELDETFSDGSEGDEDSLSTSSGSSQGADNLKRPSIRIRTNTTSSAMTADGGDGKVEAFPPFHPLPLPCLPEQKLDKWKHVHVVIFLNGLGGSSFDGRILRAYLKMYMPHLLVYATTSNERANTDGDIIESAVRVATEIRNYLERLETEDRLTIRKISFVGFSLGGIITRLALRHPTLLPYRNLLHAFVSIAAPHMGLLYTQSALFSAGVFIFRNFKGSVALSQLSFNDEKTDGFASIRNTLLYLLCTGWEEAQALVHQQQQEHLQAEQGKGASSPPASPTFGSLGDPSSGGRGPRSTVVAGATLRSSLPPNAIGSRTLQNLIKYGFSPEPNGTLLSSFQHIVVVHSPQDDYAPSFSCCATWSPQALQDARHGAAMGEMVRSFWQGVPPERVARWEVMFHNIGSIINSLKKLSFDAILGREAHSEMLDSETLASALAGSMPAVWDP
jgi:pimeloyl-ACP methyl ester carboxylesterase